MKLAEGFPDILAIDYMTHEHWDGALADSSGEAFARLGVDRNATYLIRPDGHVAFRCGGTDLRATAVYLRRWFTAGRAPETLKYQKRKSGSRPSSIFAKHSLY
jgi:hypothetical protein